jgi:hypothetical protein
VSPLQGFFGAPRRLAGYIVGLSYLARGESTRARPIRWPIGPALYSTLISLLRFNGHNPGILLTQAGWTVWCLWTPKPKLLSALPHGVSGLLAGIALVDWLAAGPGFGVAFLSLFLFALLLQRVAPAT